MKRAKYGVVLLKVLIQLPCSLQRLIKKDFVKAIILWKVVINRSFQ